MRLPIRRHVLLAILLLAPATAEAQRVVGRVIDAGTLMGIQGAFVTLLDEEQRRVAAFVTDSTGRFGLDAPGAGVYRVRAEQIGQRTQLSEPLHLVPDSTVQLVLRSETEPLPLPGISAEGERRCVVRPEAAVAAARVWEEARKALDIAVWTRQRTSLAFESMVYVRHLDPALEVMWDSTQARAGEGIGRFPFGAAGARALADLGYVQMPTPDEIYFYGPDADVLLSDVFLDHHCFELVEGGGDNQGLVGLAFRPIGEDRVPDIEGTLWLDPASSRLRHIDYRYVRADRLVPAGEASGYTRFRQLAEGLWIVDDWWIRMPIVARVRNGFRLQGYRQAGGYVVDVRVAGDQAFPQSAHRSAGGGSTARDGFSYGDNRIH